MRATVAAVLLALWSATSCAAITRSEDALVTAHRPSSGLRVAKAASGGAPAAVQWPSLGGLYGKTAPPSFAYASKKTYGVSLGGWLLLEAFITPSIFDATGSNSVVDEYTLGKFYGANAGSKLLSHWQTFVTQQDFLDIAAAGLNVVRIPIGQWAIPTGDDVTPFATGQWPFLKAGVMWAKRAGLTVIIDLHGAIGSQNGFDNSGQQMDNPQWYNAAKINATLGAIDMIATEFDKPEYQNTVSGIELLNEPMVSGSSQFTKLYDYLSRGYALVHQPKAPYAVVMHNAFRSLSYWSKFMPKSSAFKDVILTAHPYLLFDRGAVGLSDSQKIQVMCDMGPDLIASRKNYITHVAEWSPALTDCAKYLNGARWDGTFDSGAPLGSCNGMTGDASKFSAAYKTRLGKYWEAQARIFAKADGWIAWTWKTESGAAEEWSYKMGMAMGWIPKKPTAYKYPNPC